MEIQAVLDQVPDYQVFYNVDELNASSDRLAAMYPESVERLAIGRSRAGEEISALRIGSGPKAALLFAMPHPNEPIGAMTLEFLSWRLASDSELREQLGYTWYLVKCADPDGARLNEGWFKGPFTLDHYAWHYYRPPSHQQVEWTFPVSYRTLHFAEPLPETQALMHLIEAVRPSFLYSLHNSVFGGAYFYVSEPCPPLYGRLADIVTGQGLSLHRGEPEMPFMSELAPAVFQVPTAAAIYDYYALHTNEDPALLHRAGTSSFDYARRHGKPFGVVSELPYFYNPKVNDQTPTDILRRVCVLEALDRDRANMVYLQRQYDAVRPHLTVPSPFVESLEDYLERFPSAADADENWARTDPEAARPATIAEAFDNLVVGEYWRLFQLSTFLRMLKAEMKVTGLNGELRKAYRNVEEEFRAHAESVREELPYEVIPIQKLVRIQLGAGLLAAELAGQRS